MHILDVGECKLVCWHAILNRAVGAYLGRERRKRGRDLICSEVVSHIS